MGTKPEKGNRPMSPEEAEIAERTWQRIRKQRVEVLDAFIAKYGCEPDEVVQLVWGDEEKGRMCWCLRKVGWSVIDGIKQKQESDHGEEMQRAQG